MPETTAELIESLDKLFGDLNWSVVDNKVRKVSASKYLDDKVTQALLSDATVEVNGYTMAEKYRRWANANNYKLNVKHPTEKITHIWIEKRNPEDAKSDPDTDAPESPVDSEA